MKKIYLLLLTFMATLTYGQDMIITGAFDGPLTGGTPKLIEIYVANDISDLSLYGFGSANNGGGSDGEEITFTGTATAGDFIYIYNEGSNPGSLMTYFGITGDYDDSSANVNGDDALELFFNGNVIDTFGDINIDGTGLPWDYLDGWAYRVDGTGPDGTTFVETNWSFSGANATDGCSDNATCTSQFPIGTYTTMGSTEPALTILTPAEGATLTPGTTTAILSINVQNFNVGATGSGFDGHIHWTINGTAQPMKYDTDDEVITVTDGTSYAVFMQLVDDSHTPISPAVESTVNFSVASATVVADLAALRADFIANGTGAYYQLTSIPTVTFTRASRNQKYIQDATAGILIDDTSGNISTTFAIGDGMSGLMGQASEFNGVLQFIPVSDASVTTGTTVTPQVVTIATLLTDWEQYESELVRINSTTFADAGGTFETNTNYDISDASTNSMFFRPFNEADYIDQTIPSGAAPLVGLIGEFGGAPQISSRSLLDVTLSANVFELSNFNVYPNPTSTGFVNITSKTNDVISVTIFDILGKQVLNNTVNNNRLNVSSLTTGVYIMKIAQDGQTITKKLVVR
ncbi:T9SS type A sorting domain-containing protein [Bizionia arctica]|uniref:T9SS type A sorting domain-containing protein n=1 Tax=Bizionia arctica TaxID=1495645 RepID=A0A917LL89_9FLAO|nr:T9SS type A sorting domain-containing protein [Bizionia arctica]GGG39419.1 hypothetical protein GCM10010976_08950 [Bizionia arctica]